MRWLTWHYVTDGDESSVLQTGKITQQLPIKHAVPVPDRIVLKELETWETYNPPGRSSSLLNWAGATRASPCSILLVINEVYCLIALSKHDV